MSYQIALSALQAINSQLDTISQNIANTGTTGYKSSRTNFSAMYSSSAPNGVRASSTTQTLDMSGGLLSTGRNLDVAIAGKGYFMVKDSTGVMNYTRVGVFDVDKQGVLVDHMGRPDVSKGVDSEEFALFLKFMREHKNVWSKVSCPERLSVTGPKALNGEQAAYQDVVPFARRVVQEFPDRVLWGTDWPHPNLKDHMPDDGLLVDFIPHIAPTAELQQKLLVTNPMKLYWPEEV